MNSEWLVTVFAGVGWGRHEGRADMPQLNMEVMPLRTAVPLRRSQPSSLWEVCVMLAFMLFARQTLQVGQIVVLRVVVDMVDMVVIGDWPDFFLPLVSVQQVSFPIPEILAFLVPEREPALVIVDDGVCTGVCAHIDTLSSYRKLSTGIKPRWVSTG